MQAIRQIHIQLKAWETYLVHLSYRTMIEKKLRINPLNTSGASGHSRCILCKLGLELVHSWPHYSN